MERLFDRKIARKDDLNVDGKGKMGFGKIVQGSEKLCKMVLQLLFPLRCPVCDGILKQPEEGVCLTCLKKLKLVTPPWCMKCGKKLMVQAEYCGDCRRTKRAFKQGRALYEYGSVSLSIYRFKYGNRREYAEVYGEQMAEYLGDFIRRVEPDALIPIPLHRSRKRARGYNQAELLAKAVGRRMGIPVCTDLLVRNKSTSPLKYENPEQRQNNLKKAFIIKQNDVKLKKVIIVDDVYTTGSTMDAASEVLAVAGVQEIYFVALACGVGL